MKTKKSKFIFWIGIFFVNLVLTGCASNPLTDWAIDKNPALPTEVVDYPALGEETKGQLGRTLAAWGVKSERLGVKLLEPWQYRKRTTA